MKTLTVSLSRAQIDRLQDAVSSGSYASNSEVVRDALRLWERKQELDALELQHLKQAYDEGIASGDPRSLDAAELIKELRASHNQDA